MELYVLICYSIVQFNWCISLNVILIIYNIAQLLYKIIEQFILYYMIYSILFANVVLSINLINYLGN